MKLRRFCGTNTSNNECAFASNEHALLSGYCNWFVLFCCGTVYLLLLMCNTIISLRSRQCFKRLLLFALRDKFQVSNFNILIMCFVLFINSFLIYSAVYTGWAKNRTCLSVDNSAMVTRRKA